MEKIAFISGGTFIYWTSIMMALAVVTAIAFYAAFYLARGGSAAAMSIAVPIALALSLVLGRLIHWYSRTDAYESIQAALTPFSSGGYALLGAFAGCLITACLLRIVRIVSNLPRMLDAMAFGGGAGIAVGRLTCMFNASDRGSVVAESIGFPFASPVVNVVSGAVENRLATFMIQSMITGGIVLAILVFLMIRGIRKKPVKDGDVCLLFLLAYGASQIVCDSTRYDSLFLRSNGFISIVQICGLVALVVPILVFSVRMVRGRGMKFWYVPLWLVMAGLMGGAGYMEYHVQRHGDEAAFAYTVMSACLLLTVLLGLLIGGLGEKTTKKTA